MICLLVMTDGRDDILAETLPIAAAHVPHDRLVIHDDTGDYAHRRMIADTYRSLSVDVIGGEQRRGFGGAITAAWEYIANKPEPFVVHLEDDFVLSRPVDWVDLADTLTRHPHLVQLALRRQPWNPEEHAAGGIVEQHPADYLDCFDHGGAWLEHTRFFTTNPSIYRRDLCRRGWPTGPNSEGRFGIDLIAETPESRFAYWGSRDSGEWCEHIGTDRAGTGY
jgi:hypothetical protein